MRFVLFLFLAMPCAAQTPSWIARSNENAAILLKVLATYNPEGAGQLGISGLDREISKPTADMPERFRADLKSAQDELEKRLSSEKDPLVKQDLEILRKEVDQEIRSESANERLLLPYIGAPQKVFQGIKYLLDEQVSPERQQSALVRLKRYTGSEPGYVPICTLAKQRFQEKLKNASLIGPARIEVEKDLRDADAFVTGIGELFKKFKIEDSEEPLAKLQQQVADYKQYLKQEVLPHSRSDFRLPPELYQLSLEGYGVDYQAPELKRLAHQAFDQIQAEMKPIAARIAKQRNFPSAEYRDVIRELKKEQLKGDAILPHYKSRLVEIENVVLQQHLLTLPSRAAMIRIASAAETAAQPAPHMQPPPLINNHGEQGAFVLPLNISGANGESLKYDDFTHAAASWTLTAHEARPGHELQFAAMVERGVSQARAIFAFNSTNVEGWGLYSEYIMLPFMPDEGKLCSLQFRLLRAARAFLDPELQSGEITPAAANQILQRNVVCSPAFANEEVERFTFRAPGQAVSYFDGYTRMRELRSEVEQAMGAKFDQQRFHDFVLSQGLLPPAVLRKTVMTDFVHPATAK